MTQISVEPTCTSGFVAEFAFSRLLTTCKLPQVSFDSLHLIEVAKQSDAGRQRIAQALPYLKSEYGVSIREANGKHRLKLDWRHVPAQVILDHIFGLDAVLLFRGWVVGIDVTTDPQALFEKQRKLSWLAPLWQGIGIDYIAVAHVSLLPRKPQQPNATADQLVAELRQVIRQKKQIISVAIN